MGTTSFHLIFRISNCRKPSGKLRKVCLSNLIANLTTARFPLGNQLKVSNRKTMCQNFLAGNILKISLAFPLDFLAGKPKNTGTAVQSFPELSRRDFTTRKSV